MAEPTQAGKGTSIAAIAGGAGLGVVLVAVVLGFWALRDRPEADDAAPPVAVAPNTPTADAPIADAQDAETADDMADADAGGDASAGAQPAPDTSAPDASAPDASAADASGPDASEIEATTPAPPQFDLVRIDPQGNAVIAGRAAAQAEVTLALDGAPVEIVTTDASGQFVALLSLAPSATPRILSLQAALPGGVTVTGDETVLIAPFEGQPAVAAADVALADDAVIPPDAPGVGQATSSSPSLEGRGDAQTAAQTDVAGLAPATGETAPRAETTPPAEPVPEPVAPPQAAPVAEAPAVLLADADGIRVLQAPGAPPEVLTEVQLDAISYDVTGAVTLAGRGPADTSVRVTLNNEPINLGEIGPAGQWSLDLPDVDPGTYTLRLDQIGADGTITRGAETPFLREDPARIRDNPMLVADGASVITVQRGFTLWGIAEANFGDGILYVQIFAENRDAIRDPDLIFPGQIFALPDLPRRTGDDR